MIDIRAFREEITEEIIGEAADPNDQNDLISSLTIKYGNLLTSAEVFDNFIPGSVAGSGSRNRKFRVDGYQIDDSDNSLHLVASNFAEVSDSQPLTRSDVESMHKQLLYYLEVCRDGTIWNHDRSVTDQIELSSFVESKSRTVDRYRLHIFTNRLVSDRLKSYELEDIEGVPADLQLWDVARLESITRSRLGAEEFTVDFTKFSSKGLPCVKANETDDYEGYLAVIDGQTLSEIYDHFGSRLLEGNVRAYLSARGKINKGIQKTIRTAPEKFFAFNNGISCTATDASIVETDEGIRLQSAKYLQIVNGGQTTAALYVAAKTGGAGFNPLPNIFIQMKLSVVRPDNSEALDELIQSISRYSNTQNMVKESDFFSSHEFHRIFEGHSQNTPAAPDPGMSGETYWFYERARGSYEAAQMAMTQAERKAYQRTYPKHKKIEKTELAKFIHTWQQMPYSVCDSAQKNFKIFADTVLKNWGELGASYRSEDFFRESIAKAIIYRRMQKIVTSATWYEAGSGHRQGLVTYSISLLAHLIEKNAHGYGLDFKKIWREQDISAVLADELERIGETVRDIITAPASDGLGFTGLEWFKKEGCWEKLKDTHGLSLSDALRRELVSPDELRSRQRESRKAGRQDAEIDLQMFAVQFGSANWEKLRQWCNEGNVAVEGRNEDVLRNMATRPNFVPSVIQAKLLKQIYDDCIESGYKIN